MSCSFPLALHVLYVVADSLCFASCFSWFGAQDLWRVLVVCSWLDLHGHAVDLPLNVLYLVAFGVDLVFHCLLLDEMTYTYW